MTDTAGPSWATGRRFAPSELGNNSNRSSFAAPTDASFRAPLGGSPPAPTSFGRTRRVKAQSEINMDLPPTKSLRITHSAAAKSREMMFPSDVKVTEPSTEPVTPARNVRETPDTSGNSVIVFGYPPGQSAAVIQHFRAFGALIDNSTHSGATPGQRPPSIVCGRNWLRLTYTDHSAALRALAENGRMLPGEFVVGCVSAESNGGADTSIASLSSLLGEEDVSVDDIADNKTGAAATGALRIPVQAPAKALFRDTSKPKASAPIVKAQSEPKGWLGWALHQTRELVFGWDDI